MDPYSDPIGGAVEGGRGTSTRHASDWGLASLLMALALMMLFPISLGVIGIGYPLIEDRLHQGRLSFGELSLVFRVADIAVYSFIGLSVVAVLFGLVGLISGFVRTQPVGLPVAGLLVGVVALILWVVMFMVIGELKRELPGNRGNLPILRGGIP